MSSWRINLDFKACAIGKEHTDVFRQHLGAHGVSFDENRSNIYELYRATRVGPDSSSIRTNKIARYDQGLGSAPPGGGTLHTVYETIPIMRRLQDKPTEFLKRYSMKLAGMTVRDNQARPRM